MAEMSPLRRRMIEDMKIRNLSPATQRCYVHAVAKFSRYFKRSPDGLGLAEVRAYQVHLVSGGVSWDGFNQAVCALRFFYGVTLGRSAMVERIPYARKLPHLPIVLSTDEVARFLAGVPNLKHRMALTTAYAAGLRVSEVVRLKIADIDSARMLLRVEQGKGGKDRGPASFSRCRCSPSFSDDCSWSSSRSHSAVFPSLASLLNSPTRRSSTVPWPSSGASTGSSIPNVPSPAPSRCCPTLAATPTASPSATAG